MTIEMLRTGYRSSTRGFEVQNREKTFIFWDVTIADLYRKYLPYLGVDRSESGSEWLYTQFPVRIGDMLLPGLFTEGKKQGIPNVFAHWKTHIFDNLQRADSFYPLKEQLLKNIPEGEIVIETDGKDFKRFDIKVSRLQFAMWYYGREEKPFTKLTIINNRSYPELLMDPVYEQQMEISEVLIFRDFKYGHFYFTSQNGDYKRNNRIKYPPKELIDLLERQDNNALIWRDDKNSVLGFGTRDYVQRFTTEEIAEIVIDNQALSDQEFEMTQLKVVLKNGMEYPVLDGANYGRKVFLFDAYKPQIEGITGCRIKLIPGNMNKN